VSVGEIDILLVEDSSTDVDLTLHVLRQSTLANRTCVARDGEEALEYLFGRGAYSDRGPECSVKLILLDLKLPKVDGLTVLRAIKNGPRTKVIPVVILTSSREEKDVMNCYDVGANSYVQKPVDFDHFREIIKQLCLYWLRVNQPPAVIVSSANQRRRTP
jgi:two-component system, response regulator